MSRPSSHLSILPTIGLLSLFFFSPILAAKSNDSNEGEAKFSGYLEFEERYYPQEALFESQDDSFSSIASELDIYWQSANRYHLIQFKPFARITTANDGNRNHADIRELYYSYSSHGFQIDIGLNKVYWGVTEAAHLVDIINQTDSVESFGGEDKLGQPMIAIGIEKNWGNLDLYILPYFRERQFAEGSERNRFFGDIVENDSRFESDKKEQHIDYAARWSHYFGNLDIAISYFNGTSREAIPFVNTVDIITSSPKTFASFYEQLAQTGLELQYLYDDWAFKLESTYKQQQSGNYNEAVFGFEYTLSDMNPWGQDVGFLVEYLWNNRRNVSIIETSQSALNQQLSGLGDSIADNLGIKNRREAVAIQSDLLSPFSNDLFIGTRFTLNNIDGTSFLAGVIVDADSQEIIGSFEGSTRIGDNVRISLNAYILSNIKGERESAFGFFRRDDFIEAKLQWYF